MIEGEPMIAKRTLCDFCMSDECDCIMCKLGNPCLSCEDYVLINHVYVCMSNGGCAPLSPERRTDERVTQ